MNDATTSLLAEHFSYTPLPRVGPDKHPPERLGFAHASNGSTIPDTDEDGNVVYPEAKLEIENGLHQLETLLEANVDKAFDKFEIYVLRNILTVPEDLLSSVRLKHYEVRGPCLFWQETVFNQIIMQNLSFAPSPDAPTPETILAQRKKLIETRKLSRSLKDECARNDVVISQLRSILSTVENAKTEGGADATENKENNLPDLSFLTSSPAARQLRVGVAAGSNTKHTPLTTNTTFILSQLPALQTTLEQLRPRLAALPQASVAREAKSKRDERKEYIESRIRLHLERAGQLAMGDDGHPMVAGRRIDISEAHALENVASMLTHQKKA
ncbi:Centromere protein Mis12 [Penicillium riverlandense]|uniref:Centromere protein Mis12 n=1 Tax=Penicillium riverlandense TaxID=1903569 RepID=UPI00254875A8|nr:Centromere protein Mis12 [Penicillium riverlandense]KAJ5819076.1 Centromere protein Mis12 [Penicillium riverlandense]